MPDVERCSHGFRADAPRCPYGCRFSATGVRKVERAPQRVRTVEKPRFVLRRKAGKNPSFIDLAGQTLGTWFVIEQAESSGNGNARWRARHVCNAIHVVQGIDLRRNPPKKCASCRHVSRDGVRSDGYRKGRIGEVPDAAAE